MLDVSYIQKGNIDHVQKMNGIYVQINIVNGLLSTKYYQSNFLSA
jgi:sulfite reductase beta subunit-like hemoprotein